jgi:hypothetical protein
MGNRIGKEQLAKLQEIMRSKPNLVSLCGIADDATEADLSGLGMDADDAAILASELPDKGALTSLNISINAIGICDVLPEGWGLSGNTTYPYRKKGASSNVENPPAGSKSSGVVALADSIKNNGAMTSLNLASNNLRAEGAKVVAEAIKVTPAIILVPFSCPSDFSINCCCLLLSAGYEGPIGVVFETQQSSY